MRDPVAEVLAERAAGGTGFTGAVAISLLLHAGGSALAVYSAMRQPPLRPVTTLNIRFAQPSRSPAVPVTAPAPAAPAPVVPRIEEPRPQPVRPPSKAIDPPAKNTAPMSPFGRSSKKGADAPPAAKAAPPPGAATGRGEVGVGETGVTGLEGGDFPYTLYLDQMKRLVGSRWLRPIAGQEATTIVYFRIERDGTIRDASVTTPSGNGSFDRAALRAVLEASPLPPLPFGYSGTYLGVHLTFR